MIYTADNVGNTNLKGAMDLAPFIRRAGVLSQSAKLQFGDACFEGRGPEGKTIAIGVERKTLSDMLNCIDDARYSAKQRIGMKQMYQVSILAVEGVWKPDTLTGYMMTLMQALTWTPYRQRAYGAPMVRYSKLFRYLISVQMAGVMITLTRDIEHTAYDICEFFHYFQKPWESHTSMLEVQKLCIPTLTGTPTLPRLWASDLEGCGVEKSMAAEKVFKTGYDLAVADEMAWMGVDGIGAKLARRIVKQIRGWR